jgi:hypothetical protein
MQLLDGKKTAEDIKVDCTEANKNKGRKVPHLAVIVWVTMEQV